MHDPVPTSDPFEAPRTDRTPLPRTSSDPEFVAAEMLFESVRKILIFIAIVYAVSGFLALAQPLGVWGLVVGLVVAGLNLGLWAVARRAPLGAMITASVLFALPILLNPAALFSLVNVIIIIGLVRGLMLAHRLRQVRLRLGLD